MKAAGFDVSPFSRGVEEANEFFSAANFLKAKLADPALPSDETSGKLSRTPSRQTERERESE